MSFKVSSDSAIRRYKAIVSIYGTTQLHLRNPFLIAWWSAAFPGLGHIIISRYLRGYILFIWEIVINFESNINLALVYSFTGRFDQVREVLNTKWLLLYIPTYFFAIWDSYRTTVNINHNYILAAREDAVIKPFVINPVDINFLDKRIPWASFAWSALMPGIGQLYSHSLISAFFILFWWIVIVYFSNILPAIHSLFLGNIQQSTSLLDPQWSCNIPSILFFSMYDAYIKTTENNKLFEWEQSKFLNEHYQDISFLIPTNNKKRGDGMYMISTFDQSIYVELAITAIQMKGIPKEAILAVPLDKRIEDIKLFDTLHSSDGLSLLDLPMVFAALFTLFGGILGFVLKLGPIICGLIGTVIGIVLGLVIKIFAIKKYILKKKQKSVSEVVLIIECNENQADMVKNTLWENNALGVRKLILGSDGN